MQAPRRARGVAERIDGRVAFGQPLDLEHVVALAERRLGDLPQRIAVTRERPADAALDVGHRLEALVPGTQRQQRDQLAGVPDRADAHSRAPRHSPPTMPRTRHSG